LNLENSFLAFFVNSTFETALSPCLTVLVHTHMHTHTQPFYGSVDFVRDTQGESVLEKTFIHSHLS